MSDPHRWDRWDRTVVPTLTRRRRIRLIISLAVPVVVLTVMAVGALVRALGAPSVSSWTLFGVLAALWVVGAPGSAVGVYGQWMAMRAAPRSGPGDADADIVPAEGDDRDAVAARRAVAGLRADIAEAIDLLEAAGRPGGVEWFDRQDAVLARPDASGSHVAVAELLARSGAGMGRPLETVVPASGSRLSRAEAERRRARLLASMTDHWHELEAAHR